MKSSKLRIFGSALTMILSPSLMPSWRWVCKEEEYDHKYGVEGEESSPQRQSTKQHNGPGIARKGKHEPQANSSQAILPNHPR